MHYPANTSRIVRTKQAVVVGLYHKSQRTSGGGKVGGGGRGRRERRREGEREGEREKADTERTFFVLTELLFLCPTHTTTLKKWCASKHTTFAND